MSRRVFAVWGPGTASQLPFAPGRLPGVGSNPGQQRLFFLALARFTFFFGWAFAVLCAVATVIRSRLLSLGGLAAFSPLFIHLTPDHALGFIFLCSRYSVIAACPSSGVPFNEGMVSVVLCSRFVRSVPTLCSGKFCDTISCEQSYGGKSRYAPCPHFRECSDAKVQRIDKTVIRGIIDLNLSRSPNRCPGASPSMGVRQHRPGQETDRYLSAASRVPATSAARRCRDDCKLQQPGLCARWLGADA